MDEPTPSTPGARMRAARKRQHLTQQDVAARAEVRQSTVSEFESGTTGDIWASSLVAICRVIGATPEWVWLGSGAGRGAEEDEAVHLLRHAKPAERQQALKALRGMLEDGAAVRTRGQALADRVEAEMPNAAPSVRRRKNAAPVPGA